jgi:2-polyprenyl-3-methyl-5-hydroxy-6-metoxy-1,4-benzoquinol methylase
MSRCLPIWYRLKVETIEQCAPQNLGDWKMKKIDSVNDVNKRELQSFYDSFWAGHGYNESSDSMRARVLKHYIDNADINVLDAGCGVGSLTNLISQICPKNLIVGMDISRKACKIAHQLTTNKNVGFVAADLAHLPFKPSSFGFVAFSEVIEHVPSQERAKVVSELHSVISSHGYLFLTMPNPLHIVIFLRQVLNWFSQKHITLSDQIYDNPPTLKSLYRLLRASEFRIMFLTFTNYTTGTRIKTRLPKLSAFAIQLLALVTPSLD